MKPLRPLRPSFGTVALAEDLGRTLRPQREITWVQPQTNRPDAPSPVTSSNREPTDDEPAAG